MSKILTVVDAANDRGFHNIAEDEGAPMDCQEQDAFVAGAAWALRDAAKWFSEANGGLGIADILYARADRMERDDE